MEATPVNSDNQINIDQSQSFLTEAKLFAIPAGDDGAEFDETTEIEFNEKESPPKPIEIPTIIQPGSAFSMATATLTEKRIKTNSYRYVQLERALLKTNLLKKSDDRIKFENDYITSIQKNKFDEFLQSYYKKVDDYHERIQKQEETKRERVFAFPDLEKNFLALDPTRDIKVVFIDEPKRSNLSRNAISRIGTAGPHRTNAAIKSSDAAVELFYANRSQRLLRNPAQARQEISKFARRAAESLNERLPRMDNVPHRVKIVDDRDTSGKPDERALLQMNHKRALSTINRRRHIFLKMITQSKKNQIKMEQVWKHTPIGLDSAECCRELLERANQIELVYKEEQPRRPQTAFVSRRREPIKTASMTSDTALTIANTDIEEQLLPCTTRFQESLSIDQVEKSKHVRVLLPTRPFTAPIKVNWVNYC